MLSAGETLAPAAELEFSPVASGASLPQLAVSSVGVVDSLTITLIYSAH